MSRGDAATPLPDPPHGWRELVLPCQRCGATHCPCVFDPAEAAALRKEIAERHRRSIGEAAHSDRYRPRRAA